jgi:hypothetical protein
VIASSAPTLTADQLENRQLKAALLTVMERGILNPEIPLADAPSLVFMNSQEIFLNRQGYRNFMLRPAPVEPARLLAHIHAVHKRSRAAYG